MISTSDFRNGTMFEMDGQLLEVVSVEHIKLARAGAVIKAKLRNLLTGSISLLRRHSSLLHGHAHLRPGARRRRPAGVRAPAPQVGVELPINVELRVVETDPGFKGDTVSGATKPAKLETGAVIQVPLFIHTGDVIRVDTRNQTYMERA